MLAVLKDKEQAAEGCDEEVWGGVGERVNWRGRRPGGAGMQMGGLRGQRLPRVNLTMSIGLRSKGQRAFTALALTMAACRVQVHVPTALLVALPACIPASGDLD